jgi:PhnB protein
MMAAYMSQKCSFAVPFFIYMKEVRRIGELTPGTLKGTCVAIGLYVSARMRMAKAVAAGGIELDPVKDYDYDYRQGCVADPFGHHWLIEKKVG